jgi:hypothetical protein
VRLTLQSVSDGKCLPLLAVRRCGRPLAIRGRVDITSLYSVIYGQPDNVFRLGIRLGSGTMFSSLFRSLGFLQIGPPRVIGARPPSKLFGSSALRQGLGTTKLGDRPRGLGFRGVTSLRHVSLRGTGWSRDPTSSGRSRSEPKGKATYGQVRNSLSSLHSVLIEVLKRLRYRGSRGSFASFRRPTPCFDSADREMEWAIENRSKEKMTLR